MANNQLSRAIDIDDYDSEATGLESDQQYLLEWLRHNLILNAGFENWELLSPNVPEDWETVEAGPSPGTVVKTTDSASGTYAALLTADVNDAAALRIGYEVGEEIEINPEKSYRLSMSLKSTKFSSGLAVSLYWLDADDAQVAIHTMHPSLVEGAAYQQYALVVNAPDIPSDATHVRLYIFIIHPDSLMNTYVDEVILVPYVAGNLEQFSDIDTLSTDDEETFTFRTAPLYMSKIRNEDDPVIRHTYDSGASRSDLQREAKRGWVVHYRLHSVDEQEQLRRFHKKTRGDTFTWTDHNGRSYTVEWIGIYDLEPTGNAEIATVIMELWEVNPVKGA